MPRPEIITFLTKTFDDFCPTKFCFLARDMSPRQYWRWQRPIGQSLVVMDVHEKNSPIIGKFMQSSAYLQSNGLRAPTIYNHHEELGILVLEDFGNVSFGARYNSIHQASNDPHLIMNSLIQLYHGAVDVLIHLHQQTKTQSQKDQEGIHLGKKKDLLCATYEIDTWLQEIQLFLQWYWPFIFDGQSVPSRARDTFENIWHELLFDALTQQPTTFVLRDFHLDNLMVIPKDRNKNTIQDSESAYLERNRCGLLDFQDALLGPMTLDLMSLIQDARYDVPIPVQMACWDRYTQAFNLCTPTSTTWWASAIVFSLHRHFRILGVFCRYTKLRGDKKYLAHIPRLWNYIHQCLHDKVAKQQCEPLRKWVQDYLEK